MLAPHLAMPAVHVPVPCAVYVRERAGGGYAFSHQCEQSALKFFPASLRTADLRAHDPRQNWAALQRTCFLVLVAGDVAQAVCLANAGDRKARCQFLYHGSAYARPRAGAPGVIASELSENFVSMHFHGTMAVFDPSSRFHAAVPLESGVALFPRVIRETDIPLLTRWVEASLQKSTHSSVWVTAGRGDSYNEHTWQCSPRIKTRVGV